MNNYVSMIDIKNRSRPEGFIDNSERSAQSLIFPTGCPVMTTDDQKSDEVINVTLSRKDYESMREMIEGYRSATVVGRWVRNVLIVAAGGIVTLITFWDQIVRLLSGGKT